jgi:hypothetical protein
MPWEKIIGFLSDGVIMAMVGKKNGVAGDLKTK